MALPIVDNDFIKTNETARQEVDDMAEYLGVSDRKQIGNHALLKGVNKKYLIHEIFLALTSKFKAIENGERKRPGRPKKVDAAYKQGQAGS